MRTNRSLGGFDSPTEEPSCLDLAYMAGLVDGEGCIGMYWNKVTENYQLRITVEMVEVEGVNLLHKSFGGRMYRKGALAPRRAVVSWMAFGSRAEKVLKSLSPYMRVKRRQCDEVLKANWSGFVGRPLTKAEIETRAIASAEVSKLNARGHYGAAT